MVTILGNTDSIVNHIIAEVRDEIIQRDSMRFRKNLERLGEIFAYEISKTLVYENKEVTTSLGVAEVPMLKEFPVLGTILRAGLPIHQGMLNIFDRSENAFISAYRKPYRDGRFEIKVEYISCPPLDNRVLILSDPMLATGASAALTYRELLSHGKPSHTHIVSVLASIQGINYLKSQLDARDVSIWVGAVDDELTAQAYIVPGLGDAGDLAYGSKGEH
jgi:uracil phosphoribosyltransferase